MTRRTVLIGGLAALRRTAVPAHACDCHTHIFGDPVKFPMSASRTYTPDPASPEQLAALHRALHIERVVIVTPSVYGTDNSATLYGIRKRGKTARGVAVIGESESGRDLDALEHAGIRGIRLNLVTAGQTDPAVARARFKNAVRRIGERGWHIQMYATLAVISALKDELTGPVVFDHFGGAQAALGLEQAGFADLVELVRSGRAYVKISGAYRASTRGPDYSDVAPLAKALIAANAERVLWGSDWPHPNTSGSGGAMLGIDDRKLFDQLAVWAPDAAVRKKILVDNPGRVYGF